MPAAKKKPKKIYMPSDFGDRKTRREYRKPGPVKIYKKVEAFNEMGDVLTLQELLSLPVDQAKAAMLELSKTISDQKLAQAWSTHFTLVRKLRSILGIHKNHSGAIVNVTDIQGEKWPPAFRLSARKTQAKPKKVVVMQAPGAEMAVVPEINIRGLTLSIKGTFSAAELQPRIEAIRTLLSNCTGCRYTINLTLDEVLGAGLAGEKRIVDSVPAISEDGFYEEQQAAR